MKKFVTIVLAISLLAAGSALASKVNGINISHADGFTVAKIDVDGEVSFTHQTEIAKDGKPFRIIVDVLGATHEMGSKAFEGLPECQVSGIRFSQYSVDPERIVRIVFDMKGESAYRMDVDDNSVKVYISDPEAAEFPEWSSYDATNGPVTADASNSMPTEQGPMTPAGNDPASIIASINQAIDEDRLMILEPAVENENAETDDSSTEEIVDEPTDNIVAENTETEAAPKTAAQILEEINSQIALELEGPIVDKPVLTENTVVKPESSNEGPVETISTLVGPPAPSTVTQDTTPTTENEIDNKQPEPAIEEIKTSKEPEKKSLLPNSANKTAPGKLAETGVETGTIFQPENDEQSTARFRRDPRSKRIKGTMVAEFPTRLVIKYKGKVYRDPFETLINETKTHNNPMEIQVPNVEGLRLVGILESFEKGNSALFEDKTGFGYILKAGDKVQKGYVLRVDVDRVYFQIFEYGWSRTVALDMDIF